MNSTPSPSGWVKLIRNPDRESIMRRGRDRGACVWVCVCVFSYLHTIPKQMSILLRTLWKLISKESKEKLGLKCHFFQGEGFSTRSTFFLKFIPGKIDMHWMAAAIYSKSENPTQRSTQPTTYYIPNLWKWEFKCLNHGFIAQFYYRNSISSDNLSNIIKPSKHVLWVQSVSHMSDLRLVTFAIVILYKNGFYLKIPLPCAYKDIIKNKYSWRPLSVLKTWTRAYIP